MRTTLSHKQAEAYLLSKPKAWLDYPFGSDVAVYKVGDKPEGKMFALIAELKTPLRISLKCEPELARHLREKYESVMPGYHLNKKHWITVIASGQLSQQEIFDLIDHSYNLVSSGIN